MTDETRSGEGDPEPQPGLLGRLDPDRASGREPPSPAAGAPPSSGAGLPPSSGAPPPSYGAGLSPPTVDARRYRWMVGIFGLVVVIAVSIYQFASNGVGTTGIPAGKRLRFFAAPLANTNLNGTPNLNPPCTLARHDPRALNICLIAARRPLVLSFFVSGVAQCERQVDALQQLSRRFPPSQVQFAAVAVDASHSSTAALIRSHHWTIPVAFDSDGSVGALYGVVVCPMAELAYRGGVVKARLIGPKWQTSTALEPQVRALVGSR